MSVGTTNNSVTVTSSTLPAGAATSSAQTTGNASLASIDGKITAVNTGAVVVSSSALPSGAATAALQTQPGVDIGDVTVNNGAGASAVNIQDGGNSITVDGTVTANISGSISNTSFAATQSGIWTVQPGNTANTTAWKVDGSAVTQPVSASSLPLPSGAATAALQTQPGVDIGDVTINNAAGASAVNVQDGGNSLTVDGTVTVTQGTAANLNATVVGTGTFATQVSSITPPTLTKGTQGATGFSTQDLKDAGRTPVRYFAVAAAAGTTGTETAISLTRSSANSATSAAVSWAPTSGKTFRIQAITFATRGNNTATAQTTTFNFRVNTAGAVATNSTPIELAVRSATPATANAWDRVLVSIPDGWEIAGDGTLQFGVTAAATYVTNAPTWDVTIIGYEY